MYQFRMQLNAYFRSEVRCQRVGGVVAEVVFPSIISAQFVSPGAKLGTILDGAQKYAMILGAAAAPSTG